MAGVGLASIYVNVGATAGAFLVFLAARFFLGDMVHAKYGAKLERFDAELAENGKNYLLTMRFIPIFPFWMINLLAGVAGVARVAPITFLWTTSLGIIPGSIVYNYVGYAFGSLGSEADKAIRNVVLALALISIMPVILKKVRNRLNSRLSGLATMPRQPPALPRLSNCNLTISLALSQGCRLHHFWKCYECALPPDRTFCSFRRRSMSKGSVQGQLVQCP